MVYKIANGSRLQLQIPAQAAGERLEEIEKRYGSLTPALVLDDARAEDSPLHGGFTWDDSKAATAHRLDEARYLLRSILHGWALRGC